LRSPTGVGEGARLALQALSECGYRVGAVDFSDRLARRRLSSVVVPEAPNIASGDLGGALVVHLNPPALLRLLDAMRARVGGRRIIGYWAWELETVPPAWLDAAPFVHEVWVPSRFVAEAARRSGVDRPVRVVPHPVRRPARGAPPMPLAPGKTLYLTMFSFGSGFARKNPTGTIRALRQAFGDRDDVVLVVKPQRSRARLVEAERALSDSIGDAPNILVLDRDLSALERDQLLSRADVVVSLHRSEGFGLPLAEAMMLGKAVVATNWSGNTDFMTRETSVLIDYSLIPVDDPYMQYRHTGRWAEPDLDHAAAELIRLADPAVRGKLGNAARAGVADHCGTEKFAASILPTLGRPAWSSGQRVAVGATEACQ
jgi:glycosyltransferase involved in cell wall biosynthesis